MIKFYLYCYSFYHLTLPFNTLFYLSCINVLSEYVFSCIVAPTKQRYIMKIENINKDILALEKALNLIEKTESYLLFNKTILILNICEQINILREKRDKQNIFINQL